jgi:hypothetical protein
VAVDTAGNDLRRTGKELVRAAETVGVGIHGDLNSAGKREPFHHEVEPVGERHESIDLDSAGPHGGERIDLFAHRAVGGVRIHEDDRDVGLARRRSPPGHAIRRAVVEPDGGIVFTGNREAREPMRHVAQRLARSRVARREAVQAETRSDQ